MNALRAAAVRWQLEVDRVRRTHCAPRRCADAYDVRKSQQRDCITQRAARSPQSVICSASLCSVAHVMQRGTQQPCAACSFFLRSTKDAPHDVQRKHDHSLAYELAFFSRTLLMSLIFFFSSTHVTRGAAKRIYRRRTTGYI